MIVLRVKVCCSASALATQMAMAAGASSFGLAAVMPGRPDPIDEAFFAALARQPA
jgi:hypothetical protein